MSARITGHALLTLCVLIPCAALGAEPPAFVETAEMMQPDPDIPQSVVAAGQLRRSLEAGRDALLNADAHAAFVHLNKALYLSKSGEVALNWQISDYKMQGEIQHGTAVGGVIPPEEDSVLADILFQIQQAKPLAGKKLDQDALFVAGQEAITTGYQRDVQTREKAQDMKKRGKALEKRQKDLVEEIKTLYVAAGGKGGGASSPKGDDSAGGSDSQVRVVNTSKQGGGGGGGGDKKPSDGKQPPGPKDKNKSGESASGKGGGGGDSQSGSSKSSAQSGSQKGSASGKSGKQSGKGKGGGSDMAGQQEGVAKDARAMANAAKDLAGLDSRFGGMSRELGKAAERAFLAAGKMRAGDQAGGLEDSREALNRMQKAMEGLDPIILERLAANLKAMQLTARELHQRQGSLRRNTEKLAAEAGNMDATALERDARLHGVTQGRIHKGLGELTTQINKAASAASEMNRTAAVEALRSAQQKALRGPRGADQKMVNAVVYLGEVRIEPAAEEMAGAEQALKDFLDSITAAGLSLTPGSSAAIARAQREAQQIGEGLSKLAGKPYSATGNGDGKGSGEAKAGDGKGKGSGDSKSGSGKGSGSERGNGSTPENSSASSGSSGGEGRGLGQLDGPGGRLSATERERAAGELAFRLRNWVWEMKDMDLAPPERLAALEARIGEQAGLEGRLDKDSAAAVEMMEMVAEVHKYLARLQESRTSAERLKAASREECPPAYRPLVSEYFKVLATPSED